MYNKFIGNCVSLGDGNAVMEMTEAARQIQAETFRRAIGSEAYQALENRLGYGTCPGLTLGGDYAVSFHSGQYKGRRCYYCCWSAQEYVFVKSRDR